MSTSSVYACCVCGKFFQGRGPSTVAYTHSVESGHAVFVTLTSPGGGPPPSPVRFYCLPDGYEIANEPSLGDIARAIVPTFTEQDVAAVDGNVELRADVFGNKYLPGFVGMNNLKKTDYITSVVQGLNRVKPIRDFFLRGGELPPPGSSAACSSPLVLRFGELVRKAWSTSRFRCCVDPQDLVQEVAVCSKGRFAIGRQGDASDFCTWLLNELHRGIAAAERAKAKGGRRGADGSVITDALQGSVAIKTIARRKKADTSAPAEMNDSILEGGGGASALKSAGKAEPIEFDEVDSVSNFLQLTLDIPQKPLFKSDEKGGLVIPQEPLVNVLKKFDGDTFCDVVNKGVHEKKRYRIRKLPDYLILHLARFKKNNFYVEKNPTIITFPVTNLDLKDYVFPDDSSPEVKFPPPTVEEIRAMGVKELKDTLKRYGREEVAEGIVEKGELVDAVIDFVGTSLKDLLECKYDLIANICHDNPAEVGKEGKRDLLEEGSYRCHVQHSASGKWFEIQDLVVKDTMPQLIALSESLILIFGKKGL